MTIAFPQNRVPGWVTATAIFGLLTTVLAIAGVAQDFHLIAMYEHPDPAEGSMFYALGDLILAGSLLFASSLAFLITIPIAATAIIKSISRKDRRSLWIPCVISLITFTSVCTLFFSGMRLHQTLARLNAATAAEYRLESDAKSDVELAGQYCKQFAQRHAGRFPPDLTGIGEWTANMRFAGIHHRSLLRYYGAGLSNDVSPSPGETINFILVSEEVSGPKPVVVAATLYGLTSSMSPGAWQSSVKTNNSIRASLGLLEITP